MTRYIRLPAGSAGAHECTSMQKKHIKEEKSRAGYKGEYRNTAQACGAGLRKLKAELDLKLQGYQGQQKELLVLAMLAIEDQQPAAEREG